MYDLDEKGRPIEDYFPPIYAVWAPSKVRGRVREFLAAYEDPHEARRSAVTVGGTVVEYMRAYRLDSGNT